jgi:hypothetical protein
MAYTDPERKKAYDRARRAIPEVREYENACRKARRAIPEVREYENACRRARRAAKKARLQEAGDALRREATALTNVPVNQQWPSMAPAGGAASWSEALAPCKLPEPTEGQLEETREAIRYLWYLQDSVPKTPENYRTLLAAFSSALTDLFVLHPEGPRYALDDFIWQTRRWLKALERQGRT